MKKIITLIIMLLIFFTRINITIFGSPSQVLSSGLEQYLGKEMEQYILWL